MSEIKPILRQMIDNNKPHWRPETIRGAHKMLDEYEAKAKAFDELIKSMKESSDEYQEMFNESGFTHYLDRVEIHDGLLDVANQILEELESGEYDA